MPDRERARQAIRLRRKAMGRVMKNSELPGTEGEGRRASGDRRIVLAAVSICAVATWGLGCRTPPPAPPPRPGFVMGRFDVKISASSSLADSFGGMPSVEVHLVGAPGNSVLRDLSMSEYWNPASRSRDAYHKKVFYFGAGRPTEQSLTRQDPIWDTWEADGATELYVLADIPGVIQDRTAEGDARRRIVSLSLSRWPEPRMDFIFDRDGVRLKTPEIRPAGSAGAPRREGGR